MSSVGAIARSSASSARWGRPPRDTTARTVAGRSAAAINVAAEPVLAPKRPIASDEVDRVAAAQSIAATTRLASSGMSKRNSAVMTSTRSSGSVSRSSIRVPSCARCRAAATTPLRALWRLLPLPCAKTTRPAASAGRLRSPLSMSPAASIRTGSGTTNALHRHQMDLRPASTAKSMRDLVPPLRKLWRCASRPEIRDELRTGVGKQLVSQAVCGSGRPAGAGLHAAEYTAATTSSCSPCRAAACQSRSRSRRRSTRRSISSSSASSGCRVIPSMRWARSPRRHPHHQRRRRPLVRSRRRQSKRWRARNWPNSSAASANTAAAGR